LTRRRFRLHASHAVLALLVAVSGAAGAAEPEDIKLGEFIASTPPQPAPAISFTDLDGKAATLDDFKGAVTLVNLWATWCQPCLKEMPSLGRLQKAEAGRLKIVAISEDHGGADKVKPFVKEHDLGKLPIYLDPKNAALHAFALRGLPTSILIGADGKVLGKVEGAADWDGGKLRDALKPLLKPPG